MAKLMKKPVVKAVAGLAALSAAAFGGYEFGANHDTPVERLRADSTEIAKDCGKAALHNALKTANVHIQGQITPEQVATLNGLQAQVQANTAKCFTDATGGALVNPADFVPAVNVDVTVKNG